MKSPKVAIPNVRLKQERLSRGWSPKVAIPNVRLKQERLSRGWSQANVADKIGSDAKTVGRWERGVTFPSPYLCQQLCQLYGKTVQELALMKEEHISTTDTTLDFEDETAHHC